MMSEIIIVSKCERNSIINFFQTTLLYNDDAVLRRNKIFILLTWGFMFHEHSVTRAHVYVYFIYTHTHTHEYYNITAPRTPGSDHVSNHFVYIYILYSKDIATRIQTYDVAMVRRGKGVCTSIPLLPPLPQRPERRKTNDTHTHT